MDKPINEYRIRLSGIANLSAPPTKTNIFADMTLTNATLSGDMDIRDNEDGTVDQIYKIKITPETKIKILAENEILSARKKASQSQKLRAVIYELWQQQYSGGEKEFEEFYKEKMIKIIEKIKSYLI